MKKETQLSLFQLTPRDEGRDLSIGGLAELQIRNFMGIRGVAGRCRYP